MEISISRALVQINLIEARIEKKIEESKFCGVVQGEKSKTINNIDIKGLADDATSNYQSISGLIERRDEIKRKLIASNASTFVNIGGVEYTVASAIEKKSSIQFQKKLYNAMRAQFVNNNNKVVSENQKVEFRLQEQLDQMAGSDKDKSASMQGYADVYRSNNEYNLVDPLGLKSKIEELETHIDDFISEVDIVLTESNGINTIEVEG